jgi:hypothetical protein
MPTSLMDFLAARLRGMNARWISGRLAFLVTTIIAVYVIQQRASLWVLLALPVLFIVRVSIMKWWR